MEYQQVNHYPVSAGRLDKQKAKDYLFYSVMAILIVGLIIFTAYFFGAFTTPFVDNPMALRQLEVNPFQYNYVRPVFPVGPSRGELNRNAIDKANIKVDKFTDYENRLRNQELYSKAYVFNEPSVSKMMKTEAERKQSTANKDHSEAFEVTQVEDLSTLEDQL